MTADTSKLTAAKSALDRITTSLNQLNANVQQEQSDIDKLDWGNVGELNYIAEQLDQVLRFWNDESE